MAQGIERGAVLALNMEHIAKSARGNQCRAAPFALKHGIGGNRSAMNQQRYAGRITGRECIHACQDSLGGIRGRA